MNERATKTCAVTDEAIIEATLRFRRQRQVAQFLGISLRTYQRRVSSPEFQQKYQAYARDMLRQATRQTAMRLSAKSDKLVESLIAIATSRTAPSGTRATAAVSALRLLLELNEHIDLDARIAALEAQGKNEERF